MSANKYSQFLQINIADLLIANTPLAIAEENSDVYSKVSDCFGYLFGIINYQQGGWGASQGVFQAIAVRWWLELQSPEGYLSHRPNISAGMADTAEGWLGNLPFTQLLQETSLDFHATWTPHDCCASTWKAVSPKLSIPRTQG